MIMGVKAVLARSFERIHIANLVNFGIVPLTFKDEEDYEKIEQEDNLEIPDIKKIISESKVISVKNVTKNLEFEVDYDLSDRARDIILAGGALSYAANKRGET